METSFAPSAHLRPTSPNNASSPHRPAPTPTRPALRQFRSLHTAGARMRTGGGNRRAGTACALCLERQAAAWPEWGVVGRGRRDLALRPSSLCGRQAEDSEIHGSVAGCMGYRVVCVRLQVVSRQTRAHMPIAL